MENNTATYTKHELEIMAAALPVIEAVPTAQDSCWPGDGLAHDDHCSLSSHAESAAAVAATEGLSWDFSSWRLTAEWFRDALKIGAQQSSREARVYDDVAKHYTLHHGMTPREESRVRNLARRSA